MSSWNLFTDWSDEKDEGKRAAAPNKRALTTRLLIGPIKVGRERGAKFGSMATTEEILS
jgi:hypothetical protein